MNVDGQPNRRYTETDEVSVIARGRACVRTVQYRHSEVMRSIGRSHIQRCVRAAAAQAMYDPCYYVARGSIPIPIGSRSASALRHACETGHPLRRPKNRNRGAGGRRTSQGNAYTDAARTLRASAGAGTSGLTEVLTVRRCWPNKHNTVQVSTNLMFA